MTPISHVRYVALAIPDVEAERAFFGGPWGLKEVAANEAYYFAAPGSGEPFVVRLRQSENRQIDLIALAVSSRAEIDDLHSHAASKGARIDAAPATLRSPGGGYGFRLFDHDGRLLEISADVAKRPVEGAIPKSALPTGISHAVFHTPKMTDTVAWYENVLGMRVSDWLDDFMCFMRGGTTKHHCLAFLVGPPALNHVAFEMENMDAVMRGMGRLMKSTVKINWGPGRHTAGDNVFAYFNAPSGNTYEYTAEVEHVPDDWTPRVLPRRADIMDQWETGRILGPATYPSLTPDPGLWKPDALGR